MNYNDFLLRIGELMPGEEVTFDVIRDGKEKTLYAQLAKRQDAGEIAKQELADNDDLGLQVAELSPESARRFGHAEDEKGVLVMGVKPGSKADEAGIQQGDLLKEVNRKPIDSVSKLKSELKKKDNNEAVQLLVKRPNAGFVVLKIG